MISMMTLNILKALSDETRYLIINVLAKDELCVSDISKLIKRKQANTFMHIKKLLELDLIASRKYGRKIIYTIKNKLMFSILRQLNEITTLNIHNNTFINKV